MLLFIATELKIHGVWEPQEVGGGTKTWLV